MLPIAFIVQGKAWNGKTILFIVLSVAAVFFVDKFTNILENMLSDTQYQNVVSDWQSWNDDGTNFLRVLVYSVPAILAFIGRKRIIENVFARSTSQLLKLLLIVCYIGFFMYAMGLI